MRGLGEIAYGVACELRVVQFVRRLAVTGSRLRSARIKRCGFDARKVMPCSTRAAGYTVRIYGVPRNPPDSRSSAAAAASLIADMTSPVEV